MKLLSGFGIISSSLPKPGMVLLKPTSIANSGGSASIGTNGQVTFSTVTSLSLNGVFTSSLDNYLIVCRLQSGSSDIAIYARFRTAGTDASGSNYTYQQLSANGTTVSGFRETLTYARIQNVGTSWSGFNWNMYGPALAQPTAMRSVTIRETGNPLIDDFTVTHSLSTSYDGFTLFPSASSITGALQVYGVRS